MNNKKIIKRIIAFALIFAIVINYFAPLEKVFALNGQLVTLNVSVAPESNVTLVARGPNGIVDMNTAGDELVASRNDYQGFVGVEDTYNNQNYSVDDVIVTCTDQTHCTIQVDVPEGHGVRLMTAGDSNFEILLNGHALDGSPLADGSNLEIYNRDSQGTPFEGDAYLVWSCGNGTCYHLMTGLSNTPSFVDASTISADNDNTKKFNTDAAKKGFVIKADFEDWQQQYKTYKNIENIDWTTVDPSLLLDPMDMREYEQQAIDAKKCTREVPQEDFEHCVDDYVAELGIFNHPVGLRPVGEPYSDNAYTSYGDRNFKITIYNEEYRGVSLGSLDDLQYYPALWNGGLTRIESYDISESTRENPLEIEAILLEPTFNLKPLSQYNGFTVSKVEALDVPEGAVTITNVDGEYKLSFSSNFYDKVVFKITASDGSEYYVRINRMTLRLHRDEIRFRAGEPQVDLFTDFYFDRTTSYSDYIISAKILYKDGSNKIVELENAKKVDDGLGNITYAEEVDEENPAYGAPGKGLKIATYKYTFTIADAKNIDKVYINVERKGSTSTKYAGAFAGSGKGVVVEFKEEA